MEKIDTLDKKILEIVMNNARIPSKDVAQVCGVSRAAVHQRIQRLIDDGVIIGSGYNVNPKLLGYSTCTFIGLTLERGSMYRTVVPELLKIKEVVECHFTTGHYTMMIKVYARDNEHLMSLVNDRIQHIDGVAATETLISLEQSINRTLPICYDEERWCLTPKKFISNNLANGWCAMSVLCAIIMLLFRVFSNYYLYLCGTRQEMTSQSTKYHHG